MPGWGDTLVAVFLLLFNLLVGVRYWLQKRQIEVVTATASPEFFSLRPAPACCSKYLMIYPTGCIGVDHQLRFVGANPGFLRDFGLQSVQELSGKTDADLPRLAANPSLLERDRQAFFAQLPACNQELEIRLQADNASQDSRWIEHSSVPLYDEQGNISGILGSYYDISTIKRAAEEMSQAREHAEQAREAAEMANQSKSEFLANMSHEIRTPINAIVGMANLALKTELSDKQKRFLFAGDRLVVAGVTRVINDILDFSKIEANKLVIERIPFDLDEVLGTLADMFAYKAYDKGLEFIINLPANIPTMLVGDPLRLQQVLINLVSNAIKFTEDGEISVACTLLDRSDDKIWLRIEVRDTGIGMSEEQRAQLFNAFTQADSSTTRKYGGTGLGLAISHRLIKLMNGDMAVTSSPNQGSNFFIELTLPLQDSQDSSHHLSAHAAISRYAGTGYRRQHQHS